MIRLPPARLDAQTVRGSRFSGLVPWLCLVLLPACAALAQAHEYRITGRVVDAASGSPLARVEIAVVSADSGEAPRREPPRRGQRLPSALGSITTGEDGSFAFEHLPAGRYSLRASRRGYITAAYQQHGTFFSAVIAGENLRTEGLTLKLQPGGVIGGTISDASGDPVEQASVKLYRLEDDGRGTIRSYRTGNTDDVGAYEFAQLPAGTYFVSASARVWYALPSVLSDPSSQSDPSQPAKPASSLNLDVVYPRSFYGDTIDAASATPIAIQGGEHLRADLHMHAVPAVHLSYPFPAPPDGRPDVIPLPGHVSLAQNVFGEREEISPGANGDMIIMGGSNGQRSFQFNVPPGEYEVEAAGRVFSINAAGDTLLDGAGGTPSVSVSGRVGPAPGAELPDRISFSLQPTDGRSSGDTTQAHEDDFSFPDVRPGEYELVAESGGQRLAVVQAAAQGAQLDGHILKVGANPVTLAATLAPASSAVTGYAREGAEPASGVMIVLVPEHLGDHALYRRDESNSDGSFSLGGIAAGKYTVVAIRDGWDLDWARPAVIGRYLPAGQPVTVNGSARDGSIAVKPLSVQAR